MPKEYELYHTCHACGNYIYTDLVIVNDFFFHKEHAPDDDDRRSRRER